MQHLGVFEEELSEKKFTFTSNTSKITFKNFFFTFL